MRKNVLVADGYFQQKTLFNVVPVMKNSIEKNYFVQNAGENINGLMAGHHQRESNIILMELMLGLMDLKNFSKLDDN